MEVFAVGVFRRKTSALDHFRAGILGCVLGDHSAKTFKPLWDVVNQWKCYFYVTDGWKVYPMFIPDGEQIISKTYMTFDGNKKLGRPSSPSINWWVTKIFNKGRPNFSNLSVTRVEGENTKLRHYLARLKRKTLCYSKSAQMLRYSIRLLIHYLKFEDVPVPYSMNHFERPGFGSHNR